MDTEKLAALAQEAEDRLQSVFRGFEHTAQINTARVLRAFREYRVSEACFAGTTGYGYDDLGRETLEKVYAKVFGAESALVRTTFVNGTHAIACALYGALRPGDTILSVTGAPYDTLHAAITGAARGSLASCGVHYRQLELSPDGGPDWENIRAAAAALRPAVVYLQRSRGYADRRALYTEEIGRAADVVKSVSPDTAVVVDNCYGEFVEEREPCAVGADLIAGSLIKNPGGGLAPMGGYVAGRADLVEYAAERLTLPGIGSECGATLNTGRLLFQGFFLAPHTVSQALKTMAFAAAVLEALGFETFPAAGERRGDIIQTVRLKTADNLVRFCQGIQKGSPVDSFAAPVPGDMPGYDSQVVMAAGTFIQGASLELSCDGPVREPYLGFLQGGLTYEAGKYGVLSALEEMLR
ncbi:MAG: methionine gamma-lyase family protein [Oscillospiraceae bacterium]|nr:methionine gamma-lyase family protein [Oscillospiraceae bacterium]